MFQSCHRAQLAPCARCFLFSLLNDRGAPTQSSCSRHDDIVWQAVGYVEKQGRNFSPFVVLIHLPVLHSWTRDPDKDAQAVAARRWQEAPAYVEVRAA